jgi:hypothetical protein
MKELRRKLLKHSDSCPMRNGIQFNCNCHYEDCLDYIGTKQFPNKCICHILTAETLMMKEVIRRLKIPWYKRIFMKKLYLFDFIENSNEPNTRDNE